MDAATTANSSGEEVLSFTPVYSAMPSCIGNVAVALVAVLPERVLQRTPFHLQPDAAVQGIEMGVHGISGRQADFLLHAMEALVEHQSHARTLVLRRWPHHHGPFHACPGHCGVCHAKSVWRFSREDAIHRFEPALEIGLIRNGVAGVGIDEEKRSAQGNCPQCAVVLVRDGLCFGEVLPGQRAVDWWLLRQGWYR